MSTLVTVLLTLFGVFVLAAILDSWAERNRAALERHRRRERDRAQAAAFYSVYEKCEKVDTWA